MTPRPNLRAVETGEVPASGPQTFADALVTIEKLKGKHANALMDVGKLEAAERRVEAFKASAPDIKAVLTDWRDLIAKRPKSVKIVVNSERWKKVAQRLQDRDEITGELAYAVADLKYATRGAWLSKWHRDNGYLKAETIFKDSGTVDSHLERYWNWVSSPQGTEWHFNRVQKFLRQNGAEDFADALLGDRLEEQLAQERAA